MKGNEENISVGKEETQTAKPPRKSQPNEEPNISVTCQKSPTLAKMARLQCLVISWELPVDRMTSAYDRGRFQKQLEAVSSFNLRQILFGGET